MRDITSAVPNHRHGVADDSHVGTRSRSEGFTAALLPPKLHSGCQHDACLVVSSKANQSN